MGYLRGERGNSAEAKGISMIGENGAVTFNIGNELGSRFTIKTTGRNKKETGKIAEILVREEYLR